MNRRSGVAAMAAALLVILAVLPLNAQQWTYTSLAGPAGGPSLLDGNGTGALLWSSRVLVNTAGTYVYIAGSGEVRRYNVATGEVTSLAGKPYVKDYTEGSDAGAHFAGPEQMAWDAKGNIVVADGTNKVIRRLSPAGVSTWITGVSVSNCQGGSPNQTGFGYPRGIAFDKTAGNMYVTDYTSNTVRKIDASGTTTTLAGLCGNQGSTDGTGTNARFSSPLAMAIDAAGNLYVADTGTLVIRKVTPAGVVTTVVGNPNNGIGYADGFGPNALMRSIDDLAMAPNGDLYFTDSGNHVIRKYSGGFVSTVLGSASQALIVDGPAASARLDRPYGLSLDAAGNLYFLDGFVLRRLSNGNVTTLAGRRRRQRGPVQLSAIGRRRRGGQRLHRRSQQRRRPENHAGRHGQHGWRHSRRSWCGGWPAGRWEARSVSGPGGRLGRQYLRGRVQPRPEDRAGRNDLHACRRRGDGLQRRHG